MKKRIYAVVAAPVLLASVLAAQQEIKSAAPSTVCTKLVSDGTALADQVAMFTAPCRLEASAISQSGSNIGIGTSTPAYPLDVNGAGRINSFLFSNTGGGYSYMSLPYNYYLVGAGNAIGGIGYNWYFEYNGGSPMYYKPVADKSIWWEFSNTAAALKYNTGTTVGPMAPVSAVTINNSGNVGIGTSSPDSALTVNGSADKPGGGSWGTFSDRRLKNVEANYDVGLDAILKLNPVRYRYKSENAMGIRDGEEHIGFVAQEVQKVIPEAVSSNDQGYLLVNNDPILWTMLNAIKQQQAQITSLTRSLQEKDAQIERLNERAQAFESLQRRMTAVEGRLAQVKTTSDVALTVTAADPSVVR